MNQALNLAVIELLEARNTLSLKSLEQVKNVPDVTAPNQGELRNLINSGIIPELELVHCINAISGFSVMDRDHFPLSALPESVGLSRFLKDHESIPVSINNGSLDLVMSDPSNTFIIKIVEAKLNCRVRPCIGVRSDIVSHLNQLYRDTQDSTRAASVQNQDTPSDLDSDSPLIRDIHKLLQSGVSRGASDIHFEPSSAGLVVRFRVNGLLETVQNFSKDDRPRVIARLKLMSKLDVTQKRLAQNGRFQFPANGRTLDFRSSTLPLHNGESIVLRILEAQLGEAPLKELGFRQSVVDRLTHDVNLRQGLILVTGPTGSGKSTTLYSLLSMLNKPELKLITIEDPVEISLRNTNQIQVDEEHGVGFAAALKSVLRQDPDVIMVGEIRDLETAQLAAQAALTGHLVLATLHTNSAIAAMARLRNLGIPDFLIDSSLRGILGQRLIRKACVECCAVSENGCRQCNGTGFSRRTVVAEYLPFREHHTLQTPVNELNNQLLDGMTMLSDANRLLSDGLTTEQEVHRVLGIYV
ncbi:GspE/PulE family protein [Arenicella sp. 4NH20-0111]|uniref:GspE/PulE family protein n=1 Tax=Arenicella sp. 4NH20-0111 TaxID=3127648 RepID=UPI00310908BF